MIRGVASLLVVAGLALCLSGGAAGDGPAVSLTSMPPSVSSSSSASFEFSSDPGNTFECQLDGNGFSLCSSPQSYDNLSDGTHSFDVHAIDASSVVGDPASFTWTVDTTPPDTSIDSGPSGTVGSSAAVFTFSASESATFECSLDGQSYSACSSGQNYSSLSDGQHTFAVRATDAASNTDPTPAVRNWTVDATPPETSISSSPAADVGTTSASFQFSSSKPGSSFSCSLDHAAFTACSSGQTYTNLAEGGHTFAVEATDAGGNTDPSPASRSWTIDLTSPRLNVPDDMSVEANGPGGSAVVYSVSAADAVDGPIPASQISCDPASGSTFSLGATTVTCEVSDAAGNSRTSRFKVTVRDTTPPSISASDLTVSAGTAKSLPASTPAIRSYLAGIRATDLVDPHPTVTNNAPDSFPLGATKVTFTAVDDSGNRASTQATVTVTASAAPKKVDLIPPLNVRNALARPGNHVVALSWAPPRHDFDHVLLSRSRLSDTRGSRVVYSGAKTSFVDHGLSNGVQYRYVIVSVDRAGNRSRGVALVVVPTNDLLELPRDRAVVKRAPLLAWARVAATYYNVQVWRNGAKILSAWPATASLQLRSRWVFRGKRYRLTPGTYRWFVWPGLGKRSSARYGPALGASTFVVAPAGK